MTKLSVIHRSEGHQGFGSLVANPTRSLHQVGPNNRLPSRLLHLFTVVIAALCLAGSAAEAAPSLTVLAVARFAVSTAIHDQPSHVVNGADVSNAASTFYVNNGRNQFPVQSGGLGLYANLGELPGFARVIYFISSTTFKSTCVNLPDSINGAPTIVPCPLKAYETWTNIPVALSISRYAIKAAALLGKAVSGTNVVTVASADKISLATKPTFRAGQGGKVKFVFRNSGDICVQFPKTAFGIPYQVTC
jgi:hypothetical protein